MISTIQNFYRAQRADEKLRLALLCLEQSAEALPAEITAYLKERRYPALCSIAAQEKYPLLQNFLPFLTDADRKRFFREHPQLSFEAAAILLGTDPVTAPVSDPIPALIAVWLDRICAKYPALRRPLLSFEFEESVMAYPLGTDGSIIYYDRSGFTRRYAEQCGYHDCVHMILHCLFFHIERTAPDDWSSADLAAANLLRYFFPETAADSDHYPVRETQLDQLPSQPDFQVQPCDDHRFWAKAETMCMQRRLLWKQSAEGMGIAPGNHAHFGTAPGSRKDLIRRRREAYYDFSGYLRNFTEIREDLRIDPDSIDPIPYHFGLQQYGNLPLIETLEYQETARVRDMVIAVDTSGSCTEEMVLSFMAETRKILTEQKNFFRQMNVCILQCDSMLQDVCWIHSAEDWIRYEENLHIHGRGGTDFTPVFDFAAEQCRTGKLRSLKGLLYFTDGDGICPQKKPPFETAMIGPNEKILQRKLPSWCRKLVLNYQYLERN
ncbi:MAG: VWA-like domain-containing protein [Eubacteriales bacterium]|nr:VWA-like domain-containing protein [Eubacteriales bacterium]